MSIVFVYVGTDPSKTISFLALVVCYTGYSGSLVWYVTHQCLNSVPFSFGAIGWEAETLVKLTKDVLNVWMYVKTRVYALQTSIQVLLQYI